VFLLDNWAGRSFCSAYPGDYPGTIIHVEETTHNWDTGSKCEYSYTVDGVHYRGSFIYLCKEISPKCTLGNRIAVSYYEDAPENARQGSAARTIGIFVLKCSMYLLGNMVFSHWMGVTHNEWDKYHLSPRIAL